ncbi:translation initiation factor IF-2 [Patescibacteria group bacterium]|nr:translation initiation factor IF-2 [Patescibacteria group bacterium]
MTKTHANNSIRDTKPASTGVLVVRQPVVAVMGHIDHGKSKLLDYIRKTNVVEREVGGITQHISSYEVEHIGEDGKVRKITFLDTPGHEAFAGMRLRGVQAADIAILIVSAEDGVKTQTIEALKSIENANLPYIVAINKIDLPGADIERTKSSLVENEIYLEGMGGSVPYATISAKTGEGVKELLDLLLLATDLEELTGDPSKNAEGVVVESHVEPRKGISATLVIKDGTLKSGQSVVVGECIAPVRIMEDFQGKSIKEAKLGTPARVIGFSDVPSAGSTFAAFDTKKEAEAAVLAYKISKKAPRSHGDNEDVEDGKVTIPVIIKTDVSGTIEAIQHEIQKIDTERVDVKIVLSGVGTISEGDIKTAGGNKNTIVVGFNVSVDARAKEMAERLGIEIKTFTIIYELAEWLLAAIKSRTPKIDVEETTGKVKVLKKFSRTKDKSIIGGSVTEGSLKLGEQVKILRSASLIGMGKVTSLQIQKTATKVVVEGNEFGAEIQSSVDVSEGDELVGFVHVKM